MPAETPSNAIVAAAAALKTEALIANIEANYHAVHREELPALIALAQKVERVHGDHPEAPRGLAAALVAVQGELEVHMKKEELILFPAMRRGPKEGIGEPIAVMRHDHDDHAQSIRRLEELTNGFKAPDGACGSWRGLCAGVEKFCDDLREHISVENEVLFPRFELAATRVCTCAHAGA